LRQLGSSTVIEALAAWGEHEAKGRLNGKLSPAPGRTQDFADLTLRYRAPFVAHLVSHYPTGAVLVELELADAERIFLADGRHLSSWLSGASLESTAYFASLRDAEVPPAGPLVASVHSSGSGPYVLYDGWHRAAAWLDRCKSGKVSNIAAHLIVCGRF
jgi:hypothetical protein